MKRILLGAILLAVSLAAAYGYLETRRERTYRHYIEQGEHALAVGETLGAIEAFSGAIALKGDSMLGYLRRGEAYRRHNDLSLALRDLQRAAELDPAAPRPHELLGDVNESMSRYTEAIAQYEHHTALDDQSPRVLYKLALARYRARQPVPAIDALRKVLAINERFVEAHYLLGLCFEDLGKTGDALAALQRAIALAPAFLPAREALADLHAQTNRTDEQLVQLEALAALERSPSRAVALGLALARAGLIDRAIQTLRRALDEHPEDSSVRVALGRVWLEAAQARNNRVALSSALEALEEAVGTDDSSEALTLFGRALLLASDHDLAERMLQQATEKLPMDPLAFYYLAEAAERLDHFDVARRALLDYRALEGDAGDARRRAAIATRIADLSLAVNDATAALTWYQRATDAVPPDAALLVRVAEAQFRAGNRDAARATLTKALERDPGNAAGRALQRRLR
jgi:tetratricopeptide (TPR) repeat protein